MRRPSRTPLRNPAEETARFQMRALVGLALVALALIGLAGWYFTLQVIDHDDYARQSAANRIKPVPLVPGRGLIVDRNERLLAENVNAFRLEVTPEMVTDLPAMLDALKERIELSDDEIARFERERRAQRAFKTIPLKLRLTELDVARFAVDRWRFPGVEIAPYLNRHYLYQDLFAHVIGYVGRTDDSDVERFGQNQLLYPQTGRTGLERYYDERLRGRIGYEQVETNVEGRALRRIGIQPARAGTDLKLSIDLGLQQAMKDAFGEQHGAAVAVDPGSGQILGMVSLPSFDANLFVSGISHADYRSLMDDPARPLFNRNVLGGGPPGSTIKPFVALAGLDTGLRTPEAAVFSTGEFFIPGQSRGYRDNTGGAGWTDLRDSIARSVNYYYYKLAYDMGIQKFDAAMERYGFGQLTGIDMVGETPGVRPSPEWKARNSRDPWYAGETVIAGIGQGYWVVSMLQLARATAAIANGGKLYPLSLVMSERDGFDQPWTPMPHAPPSLISDHPEHLKAVQEGMVRTIHGGGTGRAMAAGASYQMAGKTGTAQRISRRGDASLDPRKLPYHLRHQALFIGYAPADNPTIAVAITVEHGGYGGTAAAPIARKIFDAWVLGQNTAPETDAASPPGPADAPETKAPPPPGQGLGRGRARAAGADGAAP